MNRVIEKPGSKYHVEQNLLLENGGDKQAYILT